MSPCSLVANPFLSTPTIGKRMGAHLGHHFGSLCQRYRKGTGRDLFYGAHGQLLKDLHEMQNATIIAPKHAHGSSSRLAAQQTDRWAADREGVLCPNGRK